MKKVAFLLSITFFISCTSDDDSINSHQLNGKWFLINIDCFCGFDPSIDFEDFKLRFDDPEKVVYLNNPTENYFYLAESGAYEYTLEEGSILKIHGADPFKYELKNSTLILTRIDDPAIADDELVLTYERASN